MIILKMTHYRLCGGRTPFFAQAAGFRVTISNAGYMQSSAKARRASGWLVPINIVVTGDAFHRAS
jgi:hypothetical protein